MDITTMVFNGVLGGSAAMFLIFTCDLLANLMKSKEHHVQLQRKEPSNE